jgi:hypothetical protein
VIGLRAELARAGIDARRARRIELEIDDHLRSNPAANIGSPREIAERFAEELRVPLTRRSAYGGFGALALTAVVISVATATASTANAPDLFAARGTVVALAAVLMAVAGQVAFVAGVLALGQVLFGSRDAASLRLVQRRLSVALVAGACVLAGQAIVLLALRGLLPVWWVALDGTAVAVATLALGLGVLGLRSAASVTPHVPPADHPLPSWLVLAIGAGATAAIAVGSAVTERSTAEGLTRGAFEAVAFFMCFLTLGRRVGIRRTRLVSDDRIV